MNSLRCLLVSLLALSALAYSPTTHAGAICSITESGLSFGVVDPLGTTDVNGYIGYQCDASTPGQSGKPVSIQICIGLGPTSNGSLINRLLDGLDDTNGPNPDSLSFQLYVDESRSYAWGQSSASAPPYRAMAPFMVTPPSGEIETITGTIPVHGRVPTQGTLSGAGDYGSSIAGVLYFGSQDKDTGDVNCMGAGGSSGGTEAFIFPVTARIASQCTVLAASDMNFSSGGALSGTSTGDLTSTSTIDLTCTKRTAWQVGLDEGQNPSGGVRQMCNSGGACIAYRLDQPDGATPWGDDLDVDTVDGISAGSQQTLTVNGRVSDQPLTQAGRYSDTVKVILTY